MIDQDFNPILIEFNTNPALLTGIIIYIYYADTTV